MRLHHEQGAPRSRTVRRLASLVLIISIVRGE